MRQRRPYRGSRAAAATAVLALLTVGCGQAAEVTSRSEAPSSRSSSEPTGEPLVSLGRVAPSAEPSIEVTRAPVDAGLDKAPRSVPARASLTARDLRTTHGGRWRQRPGGADDCVVPEGALAERTTSYGGTPSGDVVQTVASYGDIRRADAAVLDLRYAAERCGWTDVHDPHIGSAAVAAEDEQGRVLTAVSADGVLVVLVGTGGAADSRSWDALVDRAVGTACPAAVGGCS